AAPSVRPRGSAVAHLGIAARRLLRRAVGLRRADSGSAAHAVWRRPHPARYPADPDGPLGRDDRPPRRLARGLPSTGAIPPGSDRVRAFVLAGGLGSRLRERFGDLPKPLVPVAGKPFLARQLEWLAAQGVREVVLCLGHGADQVEKTLGNGAPAGVRLFYSREAE